MPIPGNLLTTAMAVMPHTNVDKALETVLTLDIPFWPQLPNYSYYEDMYVQAAEHFPGILLDMDKRTLRFSMAKRINIQLEKLKQKNSNAFMFIDEPGMQFIFSALSGYSDQKAKQDLDEFFSMIESPKGIHLCGNPDWDFLLNLDMDILSVDIHSNAEIFGLSVNSIKKFLGKGGILVWGIVPTGFENFGKENLGLLAFRLETIWKALDKKGIPMDQILEQGLISPATCCLVNEDGYKTVEKAFQATKELSESLREKFKLS